MKIIKNLLTLFGIKEKELTDRQIILKANERLQRFISSKPGEYQGLLVVDAEMFIKWNKHLLEQLDIKDKLENNQNKSDKDLHEISKITKMVKKGISQFENAFKGYPK